MPAWATPQLQTCDSLLCNLLQEDTVLTAREADEPVKHPLLDKVRECSANPDAAADFFLQILDPIPSWRMSIEATSHSYVAETCAEMEAYCEHAPVTTVPLWLSRYDEDRPSGELSIWYITGQHSHIKNASITTNSNCEGDRAAQVACSAYA
jgi:hypothetical protein